MRKFNINDKVIAEGYSHLIGEIGVIVGIYTGEEDRGGKYLVKFNSLNRYDGWEYEVFSNSPGYIIEPYEGDAMWLNENDIEKVKDEHKEDESEEDIKIKFNKIREQKKETIKKMNEKVLEMTLEIKELEAEIEKIKKEYYL